MHHITHRKDKENLMSVTMKQENDAVVKSFLNRTFLAAWKNQKYAEEEEGMYQNYSSLELQVNGNCDLKCKYCYYAKYKEDLYPSKIAGKSNVLDNLDKLLRWLKKNDYYPKIELFSGEMFFQEVGFQAFERVIDWQIENKICSPIVVPTNYSFIFDEEKIARVESLIEKAKAENIRIFLSCSVDGKYCDDNRPFVNGKVRDDAYYDRMFEFAKKWNFGFHPMIYSDNIEKWKDNWEWFQSKMKDYDIPFTNIYLLEVRNKEWTKKQLNEYYKFIRYLVDWTYKLSQQLGVEKDQFPVFAHENKLFNLFNLFSTISRGLGCSMQSTVQLRLGDLTTSVCHRAAYKPHNLWKFVTDETGEISDIEAINHNMVFAAASYDFKNSPFCNYCTIRELCSGQCLGSMFETTSDPFVPIPTVCALEHAKIAAVLDEMIENGLYHVYYDWVRKEKRAAMELYHNKFYKGAE